MNSDELRRSFRITVTEEQRKARLRVRGSEIRVVLEDESSGGFAVLAEGQLLLTPGQQAHLLTAAGWSLVRVAHSTSLGAHTRIGFSRLEDLPEPAAKETGSAWWSWVEFRGERASVGWSVSCVAICACVLMAGWVWYQFGAAPRRASTPRAMDASGARFFQAFSKDFQKRWKGAEEARAKIDLNAAQQLKIGAILSQAEQDILQLRSKGRRDMQAETTRMQTAEEEILSILSDEQRAQWDLLGEDA